MAADDRASPDQPLPPPGWNSRTPAVAWRRAALRTRVSRTRAPGWIRRLARLVLRHRRDVAFAFAAAVLGSGCQVVVPLVGRQIVDRVILHHQSALWPWLVLLLALAL